MAEVSVRNVNTPPKISRSLQIIMLFRCIFGCYYDLSDSKIVSVLVRLYCIGLLAFLTIMVLLSIAELQNNATILFSYVVVLELSINLGTATYCKEERYIRFFMALNIFDEGLGFAENFVRNVTWYILLSVGFVGKSLAYYCTCLTSNDLCFVHVTMVRGFITFCNYVCYITTFIFFDKFQQRVYYLRRNLENRLKDPTAEEDEKVQTLQEFIGNVRVLWNLLHANDGQAKALIISGFVFTFSKFLFISYFLITAPQKGKEVILPWAVDIFNGLIMVASPAIVLELAADDVDTIKEILVNQLSDATDNVRTCVYDALEYVEVRAGKYHVWKNYPMDVATCLGFINVSASFVIALLQFEY